MPAISFLEITAAFAPTTSGMRTINLELITLQRIIRSPPNKLKEILRKTRITVLEEKLLRIIKPPHNTIHRTDIERDTRFTDTDPSEKMIATTRAPTHPNSTIILTLPTQ
jgi:hypothetical protein